MKKILVFIFALILVLSFAGCSEPEEIPEEKNPEPLPESSEQIEESSEPEEIPEEEQQEIETLPEINGEPLTEDEIEFFNDMFYPMLNDVDEEFETNPWSHFFLSYYDDVKEMSFPMFLRYFTGTGHKVDEEEFQKLREVEAWGFDNCETLEDMPVPVHSYSKESVDAVLEKYAGITSDDLDTSAVAYLEEYDCYYNSTSDWGPGMFICSGGERIGNTI